MHEWGYCEGILAAVQKRAAGRRVKRVRLRAGMLHRLDHAALQQAFSLAARGSEAEGAVVDLICTPVRWRCRVCGGESEAADIVVFCPGCGGMDVEVSGGGEIILESVEYETAR
ncbi:MAG: hydrogenase maturation nickel metallochaperone HypA [Thermodesulfobacteriota bacterium]|jgi:hydrogenase nickel incorporation protein HypA/HybF